jgi:hypothetical protein
MFYRLRTVMIMVFALAFFTSVQAQGVIDFDAVRWHDSFCYGDEICLVGNFDGGNNSRDDIIAFVRSSTGTDNDGNVWVALSTGGSFDEPGVWHDSFCYGEEVCGVGDFNGDGRDDIIAFVRSSTGTDNDGNVWVALSTGRGFAEARVWHDDFCYGLEACIIGDYNGDGQADIAAATGPNRDGDGPHDVWVALSDGDGFGEASVWGAITGCHLLVGEEYSCLSGRFDDDDNDDIVSLNQEDGSVRVLASNGSRFESEEVWLQDGSPYLCNREGQSCRVGDINGDGLDDLVTFVRDSMESEDDTENAFVHFSTGGPVEVGGVNDKAEPGFYSPRLAQDAFCLAGHVCEIGDVDGDDKADIIVFYRSLFPDDALAGDVFAVINRLE